MILLLAYLIAFDRRLLSIFVQALRVKDLAGYTGYITNTAGSVVSTYVITSSDDVKTVNLNKGVYGFTAVKGTEKVSVKFVVK